MKSWPSPFVIDASLKRRARLLISNSSIPGQTRSLIRHALQIKDPYLAQVVQRVEKGEMYLRRASPEALFTFRRTLCRMLAK